MENNWGFCDFGAWSFIEVFFGMVCISSYSRQVVFSLHCMICIYCVGFMILECYYDRMECGNVWDALKDVWLR